MAFSLPESGPFVISKYSRHLNAAIGITCCLPAPNVPLSVPGGWAVGLDRFGHSLVSPPDPALAPLLFQKNVNKGRESCHRKTTQDLRDISTIWPRSPSYELFYFAILAGQSPRLPQLLHGSLGQDTAADQTPPQSLPSLDAKHIVRTHTKGRDNTHGGYVLR
jgi:hypothetical protein